jgi:hypothetical protein
MRSSLSLAAFVALFWGLLVFLTFVPFASAATVKSQLLNNTQFAAAAYPTDYAGFIQALGNFATGTTVGGIQLMYLAGNTAITNTMSVSLMECPDEATFNNLPVSCPIVHGDGITGSTDASGFIGNNTLSWTLQGFPYFYAFKVQPTSGTNNGLLAVLGTSAIPGSRLYYGAVGGGGSIGTSTNSSVYYQLFTGSTATQYFTPSPTFAGYATTTTAVLCDSVATTSTSWIDATGASISNGLCRVGAFLFVPNQNTLDQWNSLASTTASKIPFSYFYDVQGYFSGSSASSTANFQNFSLNLSSTGVGSTSALAILPQVGNLDLLSTTTITQYMPPGLYDTLFLLMRSAIWIAVMFHFYHRIRPKHATTV